MCYNNSLPSHLKVGEGADRWHELMNYVTKLPEKKTSLATLTIEDIDEKNHHPD